MSLEVWRTIFSGATLISVLFVALNYWLARSKAKNDAEVSRDKEICTQAIITLERSFDTIAGGGGVTEPPEPNRLNWLTSSRQILRYDKLKNQIRTELYKTICAEHEEHWRHQFYLLLDHSDLKQPSYFQGEIFKPLTSENIDPKSALIIFRFKKWPPQQDDPLSEIDRNEILYDGYSLQGQPGLTKYIEILNEGREASSSGS